MLLFIAVANARVNLFDRPLGVRAYPTDLDPVERVVGFLQLVLVDGRAYPLFGILLGYGAAQLVRRCADDPTRQVVGLVRRRGGWLMVFGAVHGVLLWPGDIVGAYGLITVVAATLLVAGSGRALLGVAVVGAAVAIAFGAVSAVVAPASTAFLRSIEQNDPVQALVLRTTEWMASGLLSQSLAVFGSVALGGWMGRRMLLDEPKRNLALLRWVALLGLPAAVLLGVPLAAIVVGGWAPPPWLAVAAGATHALGGYAGGAGLAAVFGLAVLSSDRSTPVRRALQACGQRSLSFYLFQSVVFAALLPAWTAGWGAQARLWQLLPLAVATWLLTVLLADVAARLNIRGPIEVLLRQLVYRSASATKD